MSEITDSLTDSDQSPIGMTSDTDDDNDQEEEFNVQAWLNRIAKSKQKEQAWRSRARRCIGIYRDDNTVTANTYASPRPYDDDENCFNILWSNVETLLPALFSAVPNPDVRNRFLTSDPITQAAGQVIERCLSYSLDAYNFPKIMKGAIKDYLLTGRAVIRVRLIPEFENKTTHDIDEEGNLTLTEQDTLVGQEVRCELVQWDQFVIEPVKRWEDVTWIAFIHLLSKEEFEQFFPDAPLIAAAKEKDQYGIDSKYEVYEIWHKTKKKVYFIGQSDKPLKIMDDPLELEHFWPIPEPLYSIQTNDSLVPIPEYTIYQSMAFELNQVSYRITDLVKSCKLVGIYDAMQTNINELVNGRDSQFFPVQSNLMRDGGINSVLGVLDITPITKILAQLYEQRDQVKAVIYEVTGISDIIRGESKASETATAQNIKASYAGLRLRDRRDNINKFIVELLRMKAELICKFFDTQQMQSMSGTVITPQIEQLLRSEVLRNYKVDIEADSTILADMDAQAQKRSAIVQSITQFIQATAPLVAQGALPIETCKALLQYALQPTKISRELEDALELIGQPQPPQMQPNMPMPGNPQQGMPQPNPRLHPRMRRPGMPQRMPAQRPPIPVSGTEGQPNLPPPQQGGNALNVLLGNG